MVTSPLVTINYNTGILSWAGEGTRLAVEADAVRVYLEQINCQSLRHYRSIYELVSGASRGHNAVHRFTSDARTIRKYSKI